MKPKRMKTLPIPDELPESAFPGGFSHRDEANALTAYSFRNGTLEDLHAGKTSSLLDDATLSRITDEEMKTLMIEASQKIAFLLLLREADPEKYMQFVQGYAIAYCHGWER